MNSLKRLAIGVSIAALAGSAVAADIDPTRASTLAYLLNQQAVADALGPISTTQRNYGWAAKEAAKWLSEQAGASPTPTPTPTPVPTPTPTPTPPATAGIAIANQAALNTALADVKGGKTLLLAPGGYSIAVSGKTYAAPFVITSADPKNRAKVSSIKVTDSSKLTFTGLEIGRSATVATREGNFMVTIASGTDVVLDGNYIHGSLDGDPRNDGVGIKAWATRLKVVNNEFEQLGRGGQFGGSDITVSGNRLHDIRSDGFDFAQTNGVVVERNIFENWDRDTNDHPDAIQWWTANTSTASKNITVRFNVILCNKGEGMQGIFIQDEVGTLPFENVTIEGNFIYGANMANGIYVKNAKTVAINGNTVISPTDDANPVWIRLIGVSGLTKAGNVADSGGEKTPAQVFSSAQMSLLTVANRTKATPAALTVNGIGWQP